MDLILNNIFKLMTISFLSLIFLPQIAETIFTTSDPINNEHHKNGTNISFIEKRIDNHSKDKDQSKLSRSKSYLVRNHILGDN